MPIRKQKKRIPFSRFLRKLPHSGKRRQRPDWIASDHNLTLDVIGKRIRAYRKLRGFKSYVEFADHFDLNKSHYGKCEKGKNMELTTFLKILLCLRVSLEEFFFDIYND